LSDIFCTILESREDRRWKQAHVAQENVVHSYR